MQTGQLDEIVVITEEWDVNFRELSIACNALGSKCRMLSLDSPEALDLLLRYGTRDSMVKIPLILCRSGASITRITIREFLELTRRYK